MKYARISPKIPRIHRKIPFKTHPKIFKSAGIYWKDMVETTPVLFRDDFLLIMFERIGSNGTHILIHDYFERKLLSKIEWPYGLGCALVDRDRIHVFGSSDWSKVNSVHHGILSGINEIEIQEKVWTAKPPQKIFNTSVCKSTEGFAMAYEVAEPKTKNFSIRFLSSKDLTTWEKIGTIFHPDRYAACPTIRYINQWYYVFYLIHENSYLEQIARTKDFSNWEDTFTNPQCDPKYCVLSPKGYPLEGINNSDLDLIEYDGKVYFFYADGNQHGWGDLRTAIYDGTLKNFTSEFYPQE